MICFIAQNDTNGAIVVLASPYLNKKIHEMTDGDTAKDKAANLAAHALLSAVEFQVTGKDPLTGAVAGVTGEATATLLTKALYDKTPDQLTASEKENISTLSQIAGGLAGALTAKANGSTAQQGGSFITATAGADTAKRAVENNFLLNKYSEKKLNAKEKALFDKLKAYGVEDVDKYQEAFNKAETPEERDKIIAQYQATERRGSEIVFGMYKSGELTEQEYHLFKTSFINQKMLDGAKDGQIANKGQSKAGFLETSPYGYYGHRLTTMGALQDAYLVEAEKVFSDRQVSSGRMTPEERETYLQLLDMSSQMASPLTPDMLRNTIDNPVETVINLVVGKAVGKAMSGSKTAPSSTTKKVDDVGPLEVNNKVNDKSSAMSNIDGYANINVQGYPATSNKTRAQLRAELAFKDANILTVDGKLTDVAINNSRIINLTDGVIKNPSIVKILTKDGSRIEDWKKMTTESIKLSNGQSLQIHFYKNVKTGKVDYETKDFKVKGVVKP
ncbi:hypothetical protein BKK52_12080 [Rodentibacter trehalosifermentans]|uniref:VENN motif-containing domain-containing protein n=1 Tax=Rodentibacter trehalosifermentans TaxID=1908263 RepID=A0A1V3IV12_9PAST|nr:hypothetical protein BKK52_12080 [Rodentibacter trehalosifermentans]